MKKILLVAAVAGLSLVSCKKDYTCECTTTSTSYNNGVATVGTPIVSSGGTGKMKKDDAKKDCEGKSSSVSTGNTTNGGKVEAVCAIK